MNDVQFYIKIAIWSQVVSSVVFLGVLVYIWSRWILPVVMAAQERSNATDRRSRTSSRRSQGGARNAARGDRDARDTTPSSSSSASVSGSSTSAQALLQETTEAGERALADAGRELERARAAARPAVARRTCRQRAAARARRRPRRRVDAAARRAPRRSFRRLVGRRGWWLIRRSRAATRSQSPRSPASRTPSSA